MEGDVSTDWTPPPAVLEDIYAWLVFGCTDKGRHPWRYLFEVRFRTDGTDYVTSTIQGTDDDGDDPWRVDPWNVLEPTDESAAQHGSTWFYEVTCPKCPRQLRIGRDKFRVLVEGLHPRTWLADDGPVTRDVDISLLPF